MAKRCINDKNTGLPKNKNQLLYDMYYLDTPVFDFKLRKN